MTTNEIMANLEKMKDVMKQNVETFSRLEDDRNSEENNLIMKNSIEWCEFFGEWLNMLIEKHWAEEDKMRSATMFLHMNERG